MSELIIKGIEMPESCNACKVPMEWCNKWIGVEDGKRSADCLLIEIPPHGDLIDQHWLIDIGIHLKRTVKDRSDLDAAAGVEALLYYVIEAKTIIPKSV